LALLHAFLGPAIALTAHAEVYLSQEQAVQAIFPHAAMKKSVASLSGPLAEKLRQAFPGDRREPTLTAWQDDRGNSVYVDQVIGKHELITYAVGIDTSGKIKGVEILEYRESYGQQVRTPKWRAQFTGKDKNSPLALDNDIQNISGATLSSRHVTDGVRRVLAIHELRKTH
jgi:Na+-translocating ferredoxin:NAD+ oxidoreductase RnfG subunit